MYENKTSILALSTAEEALFWTGLIHCILDY